MDKRQTRVAIVTGAGGMRGIGRAVALRFAREGLDVALVDVPRSASQVPDAEAAAQWRGIASVAEEVAALGRRAVCIDADVSDPAQVDMACARTVAEFGRIDVLVNNARAGIGKDRVPVAEMEVAEWDRVMAVNIRGMFLFSRAVARHLLAQGTGGHIINMSSIASRRGGARLSAYSTSKFAMNGFTQCLALELGPSGINVNAICPGVVDTGRFSLGEKLAAQREGVTVAEISRRAQENAAQSLPLRRVAVAEDIAGMAAFLISPDAHHITGQAINVCGDEAFN